MYQLSTGHRNSIWYWTSRISPPRRWSWTTRPPSTCWSRPTRAAAYPCRSNGARSPNSPKPSWTRRKLHPPITLNWTKCVRSTWPIVWNSGGGYRLSTCGDMRHYVGSRWPPRCLILCACHLWIGVSRMRLFQLNHNLDPLERKRNCQQLRHPKLSGRCVLQHSSNRARVRNLYLNRF